MSVGEPCALRDPFLHPKHWVSDSSTVSQSSAHLGSVYEVVLPVGSLRRSAPELLNVGSGERLRDRETDKLAAGEDVGDDLGL